MFVSTVTFHSLLFKHWHWRNKEYPLLLNSHLLFWLGKTGHSDCVDKVWDLRTLYLKFSCENSVLHKPSFCHRGILNLWPIHYWFCVSEQSTMDRNQETEVRVGPEVCGGSEVLSNRDPGQTVHWLLLRSTQVCVLIVTDPVLDFICVRPVREFCFR